MISAAIDFVARMVIFIYYKPFVDCNTQKSLYETFACKGFFNGMCDLFICLRYIFTISGRAFTPLSRSGWFIVLPCSYLAMLLSATYTSNLVSSFVMTENEAPISTLRELVAQRKYTWGTPSGMALADVIEVNKLQKPVAIIPGSHMVWSADSEFTGLTAV